MDLYNKGFPFLSKGIPSKELTSIGQRTLEGFDFGVMPFLQRAEPGTNFYTSFRNDTYLKNVTSLGSMGSIMNVCSLLGSLGLLSTSLVSSQKHCGSGGLPMLKHAQA